MADETILLARHGRTSAGQLGLVVGRRNIALTAEGREQAARLAELVRDCGVVSLYSSPLGRALETAQIAGTSLGLRVNVDDRLTETDKGRWEGRLLSDVKTTEAAAYDTLRHRTEHFRYPGGESLAEHQRRVAASLRDVASGPLPALVVCHAGTIRCALALAHPDGLAAWRKFAVPNTTPIGFDVAWLTRPART